MATPLRGLTVPLDHHDEREHRRLLATALRQLAQRIPEQGEKTPSETTITATTWTSLTGSPWTIGSGMTERQLDLEVVVKAKANGSKLYRLDVRILLDGTALDGDWLTAMPQGLLLTSVPTPLMERVWMFRAPTQAVGRGPHTIDLQAQTASGGSWTFLATTRVFWTLR